MTTREEVADRFEVEGSSGNTYEVLTLQTYVYIDGMQGRGKGSVRYALGTGVSVNRNSESEFEILWLDREENEIATRID